MFETASLDGAAFSTGQAYSLNDKFFILSCPELFGVYDNNSCKDGNVLPYYSGLSPAERIKYDPMGSARAAWLRTPAGEGAVRVRFVETVGTVDTSNAYKDRCVAPACIIA